MTDKTTSAIAPKPRVTHPDLADGVRYIAAHEPDPRKEGLLYEAADLLEWYETSGEAADTITRLQAALTDARRNFYRLQVGGGNLCTALRQIADGCATPEKVALAALNHKQPDPDWSSVGGE